MRYIITVCTSQTTHFLFQSTSSNMIILQVIHCYNYQFVLYIDLHWPSDIYPHQECGTCDLEQCKKRTKRQSLNANEHSILNAENSSIIDYGRRLKKRYMIGEQGFTEYFDFKDWTKNDTLSKNCSLLIHPYSHLAL